MILAGDIGATNTRLALFAEEDGQLRCVAEETFQSQHYPNLAIKVVFRNSQQSPANFHNTPDSAPLSEIKKAV